MRTALTGLALSVLLGACASGPVNEPEPLRKIADREVQGVELWSRRVGGRRGLRGLRPVVLGDRIYAGNPDGDIKVLDAAGKRLQEYRNKARFSAGPGIGAGLMVFATFDGEVIAYDIADGAERWRAAVSSEVLSSPVLDDGLLVVRSGDGRVYGLDPADGSRRWTSERSVPALTLRGTGPLLMDESLIYLGLDNGRVIALRRESGEVQWEEVVSVPSGRSEVERIVDVDADLLLEDGVLYATSYGGDLVAVRALSGTVLWRRTMRSHSGLSAGDRCIYVTDTEAVLWCLDRGNGAAFWKQEQLRFRRLSTPVPFKGHVVVADFEGYVHWISEAEGRIVGRSRASRHPIEASPLSIDGRLYLFDSRGELTVLDARPASAG